MKEHNDSTDKAWRCPYDVGEALELAIEKLVDYDGDRQKFKVRLFGYIAAADTWKKARELPYNKIA